ncbi:MAG: histidine phosphatase family protein [Burkholderiaceae bacterium]
MNLLLWRHADAEEGTPDLTRPLSAKGHEQAQQMGRWIRKRLPGHASILSSPALRARQTADGLELDYAIQTELAPGAAAEDILAFLTLPQAASRNETVVLVGHQPWLGEAAALLIAQQRLSWSVRKASVWWLTFRQRGPAPEWTLKVVMDPEFI